MRRFFDGMLLKIPVIGAYERANIWANEFNALAVLLTSGVRIDDALNLTANLADNLIIRDILQRAYLDVTNGRTLAMSLGQSRFFPIVATQFINDGEKSGQLDFMLKKSAEYCRVEADNLAWRIETAAQPTAILLLSGFVMWLVLAVITPLWSVAEGL